MLKTSKILGCAPKKVQKCWKSVVKVVKWYKSQNRGENVWLWMLKKSKNHEKVNKVDKFWNVLKNGRKSKNLKIGGSFETVEKCWKSEVKKLKEKLFKKKSEIWKCEKNKKWKKQKNYLRRLKNVYQMK